MKWAAASVVVAVAGSAAAQGDFVLYVFDQTGDKLVRLQDLNGDGDYHDAGEATRFYDDTPGPVLGLDNSQGLVAIGYDDLYATDNFDPDNIVLITDTNGDGDAFDAGEAVVVFNGALPDGVLLTNPAELIMQNPNVGSGLVLLNNNTLDDTQPEGFYTLTDLNGDGDFDDAGEVIENALTGPVGDCCFTSFLGAAQDDAGLIYGINIATDSATGDTESIDVVDPATGTFAEWINNNAAFTNLGLFINGGNETAHYPPTDEILAELVDFGFNGSLYAFKDRNGSGAIDAFNEARLLWSDAANADGVTGGSMRDIAVAPDGSVFVLDNLTKRIRRHADLNGDGDFQDLGETAIVYDAATAALNGGEELAQLLTVAIAEVPSDCVADTNGDGVLSPADFNAWIQAFNNQSPACDQNGDGLCSPADFNAWIQNYNAGC